MPFNAVLIVEHCPNYGSVLNIITIEDSPMIDKILSHLGLLRPAAASRLFQMI